MVRPPFERSLPFDLGDDGGIETDADMKQEMTVVHDAQSDPPDRVEGERVEKGSGGFDGIVGKSQRPGEHVGRSAGERSEGGIGSSQSICCFVLGSVSAENSDDVETVGSALVGEFGGVAPVGGLDDRDLMIRSEGLGNDDPPAGGHRRGGRIDDQQDSHRISDGSGGSGSNSRGNPSDDLATGPFPRHDLPMNVVVCVKQIPDPADPGALDPTTKTLKRDGKLILDESDSYGVEMALQLVTAAGGGEVTLVSMAPNAEVSGIRTALAMGAAKAILVSDEALAGSDALTTAKVLAKAIERVEGADLILTATESSDGYTGTVTEQLAGLLDLPSVTFAKQIEIVGTTLKVQRQTESGYDDVECPLPAVVSVTAGVVEPRYPSFKGIMAAKSKPVDTLGVADIGLDASQVGWAGAGQQIVAIEQAPAREAGEVFEDDGTAFEKIVAYLDNLKVL